LVHESPSRTTSPNLNRDGTTAADGRIVDLTRAASVLSQNDTLSDSQLLREPSPKRRRLDTATPNIRTSPTITTKSHAAPTGTSAEAGQGQETTASGPPGREGDTSQPVIIESIELPGASASLGAATNGDSTHRTGNKTTQSQKGSRNRAERDNWVVTTPAEIKNRASELKKSRRTRSKAKEPVVKESQTPTAAPSPSQPETTPVSRRIANREKRKQRLRGIRSLQEDDHTEQQTIETPENEDVSVEVEALVDETPEGDDQSQKAKKARKRADTPEGAEYVTIVPSIVTMYELAKRDRRTGQKSEREKKMRMIDWVAVKERRKQEERAMAMAKSVQREGSEDDNAENGNAQGNGEAEVDIDAELERMKAKNRTKRQGIRIRIVNGEHVIDEQSQKLDRHAMANKDMETLEEIEEDDLTKRFNSQTYVNMKRRDETERITLRDKWNEEETEKFYECISRFGTDFMVISKMFENRSRRHIRAKFVREERHNPARVHEALVGSGRGKWDLEMFKKEVANEKDAEFLDPRAVEEELRQLKEERELEIEEKRREMEEERKQRRLAGDYSEEEADLVSEVVPKNPTKKSKRPERPVERDASEEVIELIDEDA
jgi:transcription factor TFIIIB component B''